MAGWLATGGADLGSARGDDPAEGPRHGHAAAIAIKDAKVVAAPGKVYDPGTVVVRGGVIEAVGPAKETAIPFDAEVIDGKGLVVYPGFIDLFTTLGQRPGVDRSATGRGRPVDLAESSLAATPADNRKGLTPEFEAAGSLELTDAAGRAAPAAGLHRPALGPGRGDRHRPERPRQPERAAAPRGDRQGARRAPHPPRAAPGARGPAPGRPDAHAGPARPAPAARQPIRARPRTPIRAC